MINILFLINTLGSGGAERVLINLVNHMDKQKFNITVETMFGEGSNKDNLSNDLNYINKGNINIPGLSFLTRFIPSRLLYKFYIGKNNYDIIVAYMHGAPTKVVAGCKDNKKKKITWLHHGNPLTGSFFRFWINEKSAIRAYASLDAIVGVSESVTKAFSDYTGIKNTCYTLYNSNDIERIRRLSQEKVDIDEKRRIICTVGNLSVHKGYDRLIESVKRLNNDSFVLWIIGEGAERARLTSMINEYGLSEQVILFGHQNNPYKYLAHSDLFISSSREEGLATVLVEALALGLPVISTDVSGAKEVLGENNEYGYVVDNSENGIFDGLSAFLREPEAFYKYKALSKGRADSFGIDNTVSKAESFFETMIYR